MLDIIAAKDNDELPFPTGGDLNILEQVSISMADTVSIDDIAISEVDLTKSVIIVIQSSQIGTAGQDGAGMVRASFLNDTTARFIRASSSGTFEGKAWILDSSRLVSLQFASVSLAGVTSNTATISAVNDTINRVFIMPSSASNSPTNAFSQECAATLTNPTTVTVTKTDVGNTAVCDLFVMELRP